MPKFSIFLIDCSIIDAKFLLILSGIRHVEIGVHLSFDTKIKLLNFY